MESKGAWKQIFNHNILDCSANDSLDKVVGVNHYGGRALGVTAPGDIIQLHPNLARHWDWIRDHYRQVGISHAKSVLWDEDFEKMSNFPNHSPNVFFFGDRVNNVRPDNDWFQVVRDMNSKNSFISLCQKIGIPTPKTWMYDCKSDIVDLGDFSFPCFLKLSVSVSGLGVFRCEDRKELESFLEKIKKEIPLQIQESLPAKIFLNIQYKMNGKLERILITEQVLKGSCHAGNSYPSRYEPWEVTDSIASHMVSMGMKGIFAFDVAVWEREDGKVFSWAIECNPRYNGSSYPTEIARKIGAKNWVAKKVNTSVSNFSKVDLGDVAFSSKKSKGAVVINWGSITENEISVLFVAPTEKERVELEEKLLKVI